MSNPAVPGLPDLVARHRDRVAVIVRHEAKGLLRFETEEDLVQGILLRALERGREFRWQGEAPFFAWLRRTAESFLADRREHWGALKRRAGRILRLTGGVPSSTTGSGAAEPAATSTGPSTMASRRESLRLVALTMDALPPRDRDLIRGCAEGLTVDEVAARLGISYEAAGKARQRALDRFRRTWSLATGTAPPPR